MVDTCLFPVAGYGTRFFPATTSIPKEMLPIAAKPLILYAVIEAMEAGILNMGFITSKYKKAIEDFFDYNQEAFSQVADTHKKELLDEVYFALNNANFYYTRQKKIQGLGHAILTGERFTRGSCAVILPDDLCVNEDGDNVLKQMVDLYQIHQCSIVAVEEVDKNETHKYGIIAGTKISEGIFEVSDMMEKPTQGEAPSNLAIIGRYILTKDVFDILRTTKPGTGNEIQITDALKIQAQKSKVLAYKFKAKRFDCGQIDGFVEATNYFYNFEN